MQVRGPAYPKDANQGAPVLMRRSTLPAAAVCTGIVRGLGNLASACLALPVSSGQLVHNALHACSHIIASSLRSLKIYPQT